MDSEAIVGLLPAEFLVECGFAERWAVREADGGRRLYKGCIRLGGERSGWVEVDGNARWECTTRVAEREEWMGWSKGWSRVER